MGSVEGEAGISKQALFAFPFGRKSGASWMPAIVWLVRQNTSTVFGEFVTARLSIQTIPSLNHCKITPELEGKILGSYTGPLTRSLQRCIDIEKRLRAAYEKGLASYKPAGRGDVAVTLPAIPELDEECR